ncbi:MAG: pyruvate kinase, partial [Anaerolineae bacterium]|nr:pyruvate kinase [Anaerolineae bacterium]
MSSELKPPIILFGNTRSGATIVQQLMAVHPDIVKWYEPNAIWLYADPGRGHDEFDESDATDRGKRYIRKQFLKFQKQHGNGIVMEKTPQNILRIPYVRAIFPEATFLFIVRNPFSFINSVELKWQRTVTARGIVRRLKDTPINQLHHWGRRLMVQQINKRVLRRKYLSIWGPRYKGIQQDLKTQDLLTVIAKQWSVCSRKAEKDLALLGNGRILRLKYEDFVENPISDLERICSHCGLEMTNDMVKAAKEWVKADRQDKWRRFDPRDLARILPEISGEMQRHGYEIPPEIAQIIGNETRTAKSSTAVTPTETVRKPRAFTIGSTMSFHHLQPPSKALVDTRKSLRATPEILCTLGPASLDRRTIQRLEQSGATLFRINLSHTKLADLPRIIRTIREATPVPICLDTEGA